MLRMRAFVFVVALLLAAGCGCFENFVQAEERLERPAPRTALNGAIHYQRAILFLTNVDPSKREVLQKPIWEIVTPETSDAELAELDALLVESRHACSLTL